ncbi:MFS transporter [Flavihumibacter sp. R14]|nr:MFS transporter [Flavihumibacter soli]
MLQNTIGLYKKAYSGLTRESWYLTLVMFINRSGTMVLPFMTIYCTQQLKFTIVQAGFIMALFGAGSIAGAFIGGKITDKIGFHYLQVGALLTGGTMFFVISFLETFLTLGIGTFILSMCNESFRPANSAAVAHYSSEENRTRSYSLNRLAINLGWSFGGAIGGFLASIDYHFLFYVDGCTNIFAGLLLLKLLPPVRNNKHTPVSKEKMVVRSAYSDKIYLLFILLTILFASCFFQLFTMQPVFFKTVWHFDEQFIGLLMALNGLIIVVTEMVLIHQLEGKRPPLYFITWGVFLVGAGFAIFNMLPAVAWVAILSLCVISLGEMLSMPFMNTFWISRSNENNRGEYAALYTIAWSAAQILAPVYGAVMIEHGGFDLLWWFMGATCTITSIGYYCMYKLKAFNPLKLHTINPS